MLEQRNVLHAQHLVPQVSRRHGQTAAHHGELFVESRGRCAAIAAGGVEVPRDPHDEIADTAVLDRVARMLDGQHVLDAAVAISGRWIDRRRIGDGRLAQSISRNAGDLLHFLGREIGYVVRERLPHRFADRGRSVFQGDFHLPEYLRIDLRIEPGRIGHPTLRHAGCEVLLPRLLPRQRTRLLALPVSRIRIEIRKPLVQLIVDHEPFRTAVFLHIGFLEQARFDFFWTAGTHLLPTGRLDILAHEERAVRPPLHPKLVVQVVLHDHVEPAEPHRAVGAGTQRIPYVGFFAEVRLTRIDDDVLVRLDRSIDRRATRVIVVGQLRSAAPLHEHARPVDRGHPAVRTSRHHTGGHMAGTLANLVRLMGVRRVQNALHAERARHAVDAAGAAHREHGVPAALLLDLVELRAGFGESLVPADAHPTRIVVALGIRAFHGIREPIGMVARLQRSLRLAAAVPRRRERALVPLDLDGAAVLHRHPHAAFHLAAPAAHRANTLHAVRRRNRSAVVLFGKRRRRRCRRQRKRSARHPCEPHEAATAHGAERPPLRGVRHSSSSAGSLFTRTPTSGPDQASVRTMMQIERELSTPPLMRTLFNQVRNPTIELMKDLPPRVVFRHPPAAAVSANCYTDDNARTSLIAMGM